MPDLPTILERKIKADGSQHEYRCGLLYTSATFALVRFEMRRGGTLPGLPVEIPPGSISDGYFWARRPYSIYRMRRADGSIIAHRFDAVTAVTITPELISYRDLVLDWWVLPDGRILEEDRDELEEMVAAGAISEDDRKRAEQAAATVLGRYRHIIDELERLEARHGAMLPSP